MRRIELDKEKFMQQIVEGKTPPWQPVPSRRFASMLGVSLQVLANYRVRDKGPPPAAHRRGAGHRTFYRLDEAASWASNGNLQPWQVNRDWLALRDIEVAGESTEESTNFLVEAWDRYCPVK